MQLTLLNAKEAATKQRKGALLIDLSDACDYRREHINGSISQPFSVLREKGLPRQSKDAPELVFYCRVGLRTKMAAPHLAKLCGNTPVYMLEDGLRAWKAAKLPTEINRSAPIELMRQVHICAGFLVLLGAVLGYLVSPYFYALCAFVGCGLLFAGISGWCGMAVLLAKMPWNRVG